MTAGWLATTWPTDAHRAHRRWQDGRGHHGRLDRRRMPRPPARWARAQLRGGQPRRGAPRLPAGALRRGLRGRRPPRSARRIVVVLGREAPGHDGRAGGHQAHRPAYAGGSGRPPVRVHRRRVFPPRVLQAALPPGRAPGAHDAEHPACSWARASPPWRAAAHATPDDVALVSDLFACLGTACVVDEDGHRRRGRAQRVGAGLRRRLRGGAARRGCRPWASIAALAESPGVRDRARHHRARWRARGRTPRPRAWPCAARAAPRSRRSPPWKRPGSRPPSPPGLVRRRTPIEGVGPVLRYPHRVARRRVQHADLRVRAHVVAAHRPWHPGATSTPCSPRCATRTSTCSRSSYPLLEVWWT